jgi:hypothetical protein
VDELTEITTENPEELKKKGFIIKQKALKNFIIAWETYKNHSQAENVKRLKTSHQTSLKLAK